MYTVWFYRFHRGRADATVAKMCDRGLENLYPGVNPKGGTLLGRVWGHQIYTHASVFSRDLAGARAEVQDVDNLLRNLRLLSPAVAAMEVRNTIPRDDADLARLGEDGWHTQMVQPWLDAAKKCPEVAYHLNVIGMACFKQNTFPPYMVQALWRDMCGYAPKWFGGSDPRAHWPAELRQATK